MDETEVIVRLLNQLSIKLSVLDKRVANLEQTTGDMGKIKPDNFQPRPDLISIESRLENLERAVIRNSKRTAKTMHLKLIPIRCFRFYSPPISRICDRNHRLERDDHD